MELCKICNKNYKNLSALSVHLIKQHSYKLIDYKIKYENFNIPKCKFYNSNAMYANSSLNFHKTCNSLDCRKKQKSQGTPHTEETKKRLSEKMKIAHAEGRANNWQDSKKYHNSSYPEQFFIKVIDNEFNNKNYTTEHRVGAYAIDFAWIDKKLAIEIDGKQHMYIEQAESDIKKDIFLKTQGWEILRIKWLDLFKNTQQCIKWAKDFIDDENYSEVEYLLYIYENYKCELNFNLLRESLRFNIKFSNDGKKILHNKGEIDNKINLIINSNINFSKFGWVGLVAKILNISSAKVNGWMKRNMLEFYNEKCFKKRPIDIVNPSKKSREEIEKSKLNKEQNIKIKMDLILNSNINFSKFGWIGQTSKILNIKNVRSWMKRNMLEFYNKKCFKKLGNGKLKEKR